WRLLSQDHLPWFNVYLRRHDFQIIGGVLTGHHLLRGGPPHSRMKASPDRIAPVAAPTIRVDQTPTPSQAMCLFVFFRKQSSEPRVPGAGSNSAGTCAA